MGRERDRAEILSREARSTIDGMLAQLSDRHEMDVPGLQPARAALLESALHYYENASDRPGIDLELARNPRRPRSTSPRSTACSASPTSRPGSTRRP